MAEQRLPEVKTASVVTSQRAQGLTSAISTSPFI
jgi:hypothetical protein